MIRRIGIPLLLVVALGTHCARTETACYESVRSPIESLASPPDARQLLRRVEERYAGLRSYSDRGCVFETYHSRLKVTSRRPFETTFARPATFRFEYTESKLPALTTRYVIWTEGGAVRSWGTVHPKVETYRSIRFAAGAAGGVSRGSSTMIPSLLLGSGVWITRVEKARVVGSQRLSDGTACYLVGGEDRRGDPVRIWVDMATLAIRRVQTEMVLPSSRTRVESTTILAPAFNGPVDPARIGFKPPRQIGVGPFRIDKSRASDRHLTCDCV